jgi:hypothetical protein
VERASINNIRSNGDVLVVTGFSQSVEDFASISWVARLR